MQGLEKTARKTSTGIQKAFNAIKLTAVVAALIKLTKYTTSAASDLVEVQNVVDVSFGKSAQKVNAWAKTVIKNFGLSQTEAKRTASTFMAMSNGMDIANDAGTTMAITLTELSADLASFWNTSQAEAFTALKSVYTGETETLKKYGIVMTEANLKAFALTQGIKKQYSEMSQAEKVALRYKFVIKTASDAQGDFARNSTTWANQIKILKTQLQELATMIGQVFVKVLRPALIVINKLLSRIIALGNAISTAFGGNKVEDTSNGLNSTASSAEDLANNLANSNEEAKELKKNLMSFDELNTLDDSGSKENSSNSNVDLGIPTLDIKIDDSTVDPQLQKIAEKIKAWRDKIVSFFSDKTIKEALTDLGKAILNFVKDLSKSIYDLIVEQLTRVDWKDALVRFTSVTAQIVNEVNNTSQKIVDTIKTLFNQIDWNFLIAGVIATFGNLGIAVFEIVNTIVDTVKKIVEQLELGELINKFVGYFGVLHNAALLLTQVVNALCSAFTIFYDTGLAPIVEWIGEKLADALTFTNEELQKWTNWVVNIMPDLNELAQILGEMVSALWDILKPLADYAWEVFKDVISTIGDVLRDVFQFILDHKEAVIAALTGITTAFVIYKGAVALGKAVVVAYEIAQSIMWAVMAVGEGVTKALAVAQEVLNAVMNANPFALVVVAISAIVMIITYLWQTSEEFRDFWINLWESIKDVINKAADFIGGIIDGIVEAIQKAIDWISNAIDKVKEFFGISGKNSTSTSTSRSFAKQSIDVNYVPNSIPALANGGVISSPTIAQIGEYAGANSNPEIVAPQSIMRDTVQQANSGVINAIFAIGNQITKAVDDKDMDVYMDADKVTRKVTKRQDTIKRQQGTSLVTI